MGVLNSILPIAIMLILGYLAKIYFIKDKKFWKNINKLVYYIMFPIFIVYSIAKTDFHHTNITFIPVLISIILIFVRIIWLTRAFFKDKNFWVAFLQGSIKYNSYVFIGVVLYYIKEDTMPIIALITAFMIMTTNIISVFILNQHSKNKKNISQTFIATLMSPPVFSCLLGLALNYISNFLPSIIHIIWLNNTLDKIGSASLALSLIGVGASLNLNMDSRKIIGALLSSFIKLIILPSVVFITLSSLHFNQIIVLVCTIYAGSPCSANATAMTEAFGGDGSSMSFIISLETILSMFTLSVWLILFQYGHI